MERRRKQLPKAILRKKSNQKEAACKRHWTPSSAAITTWAVTQGRHGHIDQWREQRTDSQICSTNGFGGTGYPLKKKKKKKGTLAKVSGFTQKLTQQTFTMLL